ncbi:MAG: hypothetical protein GEV13_04830 [Rhodospirillales bacterium]|nr:hypothetical protein [Rhodospirillales bacterium]
MLAKYDPVASRNLWLANRLDYVANSDPVTIPVAARAHYVQLQTTRVIDAYLVGLAEEVRPVLEKLLAWMDRQPEPYGLVCSGSEDNEDAWGLAVFEWRQALGLCRWLLHGDGSEQDLTASLEADLQGLAEASPRHAAKTRAGRLEQLSLRLAMALAANNPELGLRLFDRAAPSYPPNLVAPILGFGVWACERLRQGGARDSTFVEGGKEMLTMSLLPKFFWEHARIEPALWLKAIYFDSGVVRTPEQAIAKAYDSMPGVERPEFVPG